MEGHSMEIDLQRKKIMSDIIRDKYLYIMLIPIVVYYLVFAYYPMYGAVIAFKNFNPRLGILGSPWAKNHGLFYFQKIFRMPKFPQVLYNTISISLIRLVFGFPFPIIVSILMNEIRKNKYKKFVQTSVCLPEFISWVVLGGIFTSLLSTENGLINGIIKSIGFEPIPFLTSPKFFIPTMVVTMIWKTFGWNTIIYMASLSSISPEYYEAATIDGANRWQRIWHITLPCIRGIIVTMLILRIGGLLQAGFEQIFVMYHPGVYKVADIIDTWVFRIGLQDGKFEMAAAIGLFKSVISAILIIVANSVARKLGERGIF